MHAMVGGCGRYNPGFVRRVDSVCVSDDGNQSSYAARTVWHAGVGGALDSTQCGGYLSVRLPAVASSVMCRKATQWRVQPCLHPPSPAPGFRSCSHSSASGTRLRGQRNRRRGRGGAGLAGPHRRCVHVLVARRLRRRRTRRAFCRGCAVPRRSGERLQRAAVRVRRRMERRQLHPPSVSRGSRAGERRRRRAHGHRRGGMCRGHRRQRACANRRIVRRGVWSVRVGVRTR